MMYVIVILSMLCAVLLAWVIHLKGQLRSVSRQLEKRLSKHTHNAISITLMDPDTERMAAAVNRCLEKEEETRLTLERQEKEFRATIANISHDLRTPLTAVKGYLQLLSGTPLDEVQRSRLNIIQRHITELGVLIEHFFEYSFLLSDETELNPETFSLTDEVMECLAAAVPQFEEKGMQVCLAQCDPIRITADREKTVRILQNLIRNGIQHADGNIIVSVRNEASDVRVCFSNPVRQPEQIDVGSLFDRFYTSDQSRRKSTGLGLSIVKLLTERMGGRVFALLEGNIITIGFTLPRQIQQSL